ncbi:pyridoxal phosphate-dependent decarboxylase family protein [Rheinheimera maricola]|uniref:Aminotransferase class I/II-fold pyridoxal phosphate-dependent enzyme n=1 Tax=Rheinheimera maricola TaxID=2793282 RepID=A0ABS7X6B0_9GAMM|nr:pyridoxal-dependent decarboxylase [Rheinheimera maricola]MBZ9611080.1 aminotransferase class I/II-fold pyridoxal phosphate-dependent enzyme [Rheinheimera maricola]
MQYSLQANQTILDALSRQFFIFHQSLQARDVASKKLAQPTVSFPERGISFKQLDQLIETCIQPGLSASNGGRYWGFVTGGANPIATYADWLVTTFNQNVSKGGDSVATALEQQTLAWLCELFELPQTFGGTFTTGATAANLLAVITARQYAGKQQGIDVAKSGMKHVNVSIYSATPHASMIKSLGLAGLGQDSWQPIVCNNGEESMNIAALEAALNACNASSKIVIASAATVTGTDYDDFTAISKICKRYNAWLHVDAAFGIFERLITGKDGKTRGIEYADSITLDCHKWLNVPYDCGVFLTRHIPLLQASCEVAAPYLAGSENGIPFMSLGIENSRRFRAFPVWATLMGYGREGIRANIKANIEQAAILASWLDKSAKFDLVKRCELNVVLFKPNSAKLNLSSNECIAKLNASGQVFLTPGNWQGQPIIRAALSNWSISVEDVEKVIAILATL